MKGAKKLVTKVLTYIFAGVAVLSMLSLAIATVINQIEVIKTYGFLGNAMMIDHWSFLWFIVSAAIALLSLAIMYLIIRFREQGR